MDTPKVDGIKLHLGCGDVILDGWVNIDLYDEHADLKWDIKHLPYDENTIDEIYNAHVIEHFDFYEAFDVLREWHRVLKPGGSLTVETPDFLETCRKFVNSDEQTRINLYGHIFAKPWLPGQIHKFLYTENQLRWTLMQCGFKNINRVSARRYIGMEDICLKLVAQK